MIPLLLVTLLLGDAPFPNVMPLWTGEVPLSVGKPENNRPTVTLYAAKPVKDGAAVVICPGGGYGFLAMDHEGKQVAEWFNERGVTAFVLTYRITAGKDRPGPLGDAPMLDVQRAIRFARSSAQRFSLDPKKIGVCGFSAGGHLASTAATHFDAGKPNAADPIDRVSCRPDFAVLAYPVISMKKGITHGGSRNNLLGENPDDARVELFSNETQVTKDTPPTFLFHTDEDSAVFPENSVLFYAAMKKHKVPGELHIFEKGVHGLGLGTDPKWTKGNTTAAAWTGRLEVWLKGRGIVK